MCTFGKICCLTAKSGYYAHSDSAAGGLLCYQSRRPLTHSQTLCQASEHTASKVPFNNLSLSFLIRMKNKPSGTVFLQGKFQPWKFVLTSSTEEKPKMGADFWQAKFLFLEIGTLCCPASYRPRIIVQANNPKQLMSYEILIGYT